MSLSGKASGKAKGDILRGNIRALKTLKGYSAYEVALINGFEGTEEEWLASLKGEKGDPQVFIAEYGVTSFVDVFDAFWRGSKICFCKKDEMVLPVRHVDTVMHIDGRSKVIFGGFFEGEYHEWTVSGNVTSFTWAESCETPTSDFVVQFSGDDIYCIQADKTNEEIEAAYAAGKKVTGCYNGEWYDYAGSLTFYAHHTKELELPRLMYDSYEGGYVYALMYPITKNLSIDSDSLEFYNPFNSSGVRVDVLPKPETGTAAVGQFLRVSKLDNGIVRGVEAVDLESDVFVATYGETTYEEVTEAINAGKVCFCKNAGKLLPLTNAPMSTGSSHMFGGYYGGVWLSCVVTDGSEWQSSSKNITVSISEASTDKQIPTAKAVYDALQDVEREPEVFVATYGSTSFAEVTEAFEAGKVCFCKGRDVLDENTTILPLAYITKDSSLATNAYCFAGYDTNKLTYYRLKSPSLWSKYIRNFGTSIGNSSTDIEIPSAKAVYTFLQNAKESGEFDGADGVTPNIQIGTVETLEAGSNATASISGTAENPLLNLGIPKGADGEGGGGVDEAVDMSPLTVSLSADDVDFEVVYYESLTDEEKSYYDTYRFLGDPGAIIVSLNYDDIYAALKAGRTVRIKLPKEFCVDNAHWDYPVCVVTAYGLTPFGLSVRTINASYIFTEGSSHRTDLDPGATYDDTE